jgi:hypothetical protein
MIHVPGSTSPYPKPSSQKKETSQSADTEPSWFKYQAFSRKSDNQGGKSESRQHGVEEVEDENSDDPSVRKRKESW